MRGDYWVPSQEKLITGWEYATLRIALEAGFSVVFDSTNLNEKTLDKVESIINDYDDYEIEYKFFDTPLATCIERDSKRERPVGAGIITNFYNRYVKHRTDDKVSLRID